MTALGITKELAASGQFEHALCGFLRAGLFIVRTGTFVFHGLRTRDGIIFAICGERRELCLDI